MGNFEFNERGMRDLAKHLTKDVAKEDQKWMDTFARRHKNEPVDRVASTLKREWERRGGKLSRQEAHDWATHISEGTRIEFKA